MRLIVDDSGCVPLHPDYYCRNNVRMTAGMRAFMRGAVVSGVRLMNEVKPRRARLVLGWVTVLGRVYHLGM